MFQKSTLVCCFLAICSSTTIQARTSGENENEMQTMAKKCNAKNEDLVALMGFNVPKTDSGKCLMLCLAKQVNIIDGSGKFSPNGATGMMTKYWTAFSKEEVLKIVSECGQVANEHKSKVNTCDYGYLVGACFQSKMKEVVSVVIEVARKSARIYATQCMVIFWSAVVVANASRFD